MLNLFRSLWPVHHGRTSIPLGRVQHFGRPWSWTCHHFRFRKEWRHFRVTGCLKYLADSCISTCTFMLNDIFLQRTIRPQVVTTFELPGCNDMWTVKGLPEAPASARSDSSKTSEVWPSFYLVKIFMLKACLFFRNLAIKLRMDMRFSS